MAIKVVVNVFPIELENGQLTIPTSVRLDGQTGAVSHSFTGVAANIPNSAAMIPYLKAQVVSYVQSFFGATVVDTEIALNGGPL